MALTGLIIEEGMEMALLRRILDSVKKASVEAGVQVVTGDTKVVARGQCDGLYINTAGIGRKIDSLQLGVQRIRRGDMVIASGTLGDHGMAVMAAREGLSVRGTLRSDTAPVHRLVARAAEWADALRFMRDPTRGGLASVLGEIVEEGSFGIELQEGAIPYDPGARAVSEILGIDLLHVACEGRMLLISSPEAAPGIVSAWREMPEGTGAAVIGEVTDEAGRLILRTDIGGRRMVDIPQGELLPRIC